MTMNLKKARSVASSILNTHGPDYRSVVDCGHGSECAVDSSCRLGCVNVVLVKDGVRYSPTIMDDPRRHETDGYTLASGCFVGTILIKAGLATAEDFIKANVWSSSVATASRRLNIELTTRAQMWLGWAQGEQDRGKTWGEAFSGADSHVMSHIINSADSGNIEL
jgi:hypothetical protein